MARISEQEKKNLQLLTRARDKHPIGSSEYMAEYTKLQDRMVTVNKELIRLKTTQENKRRINR